MKLYLLSQDVNPGYDTYDSCVVAAMDEDSARVISPSAYSSETSWCNPADVNVECIGIANDGTVEGVICASFNAG